ncbi:Maltokinase [Corynebacterium kalinowskii]|uniref:Maltokinase n=1 Tax=Corynebacterium kalinowskii TaxID=2675216 RepID=A0A6B8VJD8_9CORY|nr:trehalose synthase [Corynebacterium kalinowskii]QGU01584.1 Maltokinase [Corynebacterium kalinowskii]
MYESIANQRFFRSKQAGITELKQLATADVGNATWALVDVDGDLYQLILSGQQDVLDSPEVLAHIQECFDREEAFGLGELEVLSRPVIPAEPQVSVSTAEQSNSSLIFRGEKPAIAKLFRMLEPGINPDVELLTGLAGQKCSYVPALRAYSTVEWDGETYVTAMVQDFAEGCEEGWARATATAEPFTEDAAMIGEALRHIHHDLAQAFGSDVVPAAQVIDGLKRRMESLICQAEVLEEFRPAITAVYEEASAGETTIQRIHGDAHLGQILRSSDRYLFIDFEGEPARPLSERRGKFSPLQDVAGLVRSFDYAAHFGGRIADPETWAKESTDVFLAAYRAQDSALLRALILDKALYEVVYEANNRPDWLHIPLEAVKRLVG